MPRRLKVATKELGDLELYAIYSQNGIWEKDLAPIQEWAEPLVTVITKEVFDQALLGWTSPLIKTLGLAPHYTLRRLTKEAQGCFQNKKCPFFEKKQCQPLSKKMPWCFEPNIGVEEVRRKLAAELIGYWREGVYILAIEDLE